MTEGTDSLLLLLFQAVLVLLLFEAGFLKLRLIFHGNDCFLLFVVDRDILAAVRTCRNLLSLFDLQLCAAVRAFHLDKLHKFSPSFF